MKLSPFLAPERVLVAPAERSKPDVLELMVRTLASGPGSYAGDLGLLRTAVLERERELTTGLERGIALPHGATNCKETTAALAIFGHGIDFASLDGKPTQFVIAVTFPSTQEGRRRHLEFLNSTVRIFTESQARKEFLAARSAAACLEVLRRAESRVGL